MFCIILYVSGEKQSIRYSKVWVDQKICKMCVLAFNGENLMAWEGKCPFLNFFSSRLPQTYECHDAYSLIPMKVISFLHFNFSSFLNNF